MWLWGRMFLFLGNACQTLKSFLKMYMLYIYTHTCACVRHTEQTNMPKY